MAYDAALGTRINDLGDLSTQGDVGHGRLLAQNGHQSEVASADSGSALGQLAEESIDLVLIVDHSAGP